ncbi:hypothetical protein [Streptomyces sp. WM6378]|uniref:hypothetical protein n=1 Tax=Streptomyces sp. WM6378 TaxID=1415557 RepID=UPI0006B04276|nr:hypothetical protein [Streptomyces sp. WM6378]
MTTIRARKALISGAVGAAAAATALVAFTAAEAAPRSAAAAAATTTAADMPSTVETFAYPNAAKILADQKIVLKRGDGRILLTDCASAWDIQVESRTGGVYFCFAVSGKQGYLTMELPDTYGIWTKEHPVKATLTAKSDGEQSVVNAPAAEAGQETGYTPVGETGNIGKRSALVELRVTG